MMKKKQPARSGGFSAGLEGGTTLIAHNTRLKGNLIFEEQLYINGEIEGDVSALAPSDSGSGQATLVVCEGGRVIGEVRAPNVVIDGTVEGDVYATGKLELASKAKVLGNVHYNLVEMHLGSVVNGQMVSLSESATSIRGAQGTQSVTDDSNQSDLSLSKDELAKQKLREAAGDVVTGIR